MATDMATGRRRTPSTSANRPGPPRRRALHGRAAASGAGGSRGWWNAGALRLRPFVVAGRAYQVSVAGCAGAVDTEFSRAPQVPVEAASHRDRGHIVLSIVGPVMTGGSVVITRSLSAGGWAGRVRWGRGWAPGHRHQHVLLRGGGHRVRCGGIPAAACSPYGRPSGPSTRSIADVRSAARRRERQSRAAGGGR